MDNFIIGNEANLILDKRLNGGEDINTNIQSYSNCCNAFKEEDTFLNANPYKAESDQSKAWNLGYANKPLHTSLSNYKLAYNLGKAERISDLAKGGLSLLSDAIDVYGNIKKQTQTTTDEEDSPVDIDIDVGGKKKDSKNKELIITGSIFGGVLAILIVAVIVKKNRK